MSVREAESDAIEVLETLWSPGRGLFPVPVDPILIASDLGIRVERVLMPTDQSGSIIMVPGETPVISVNARDSLKRQRFTCAHEIGHYRQRQSQGSARFVDYRDTLAGLGVNPDEIYANQFAAALLMPAIEVKRRVDEHYGVSQLAAAFATSVQAMELRLRNLSLPY